jgi:E3 ubiquitin-protein ligase HUWE1
MDGDAPIFEGEPIIEGDEAEPEEAWDVSLLTDPADRQEGGDDESVLTDEEPYPEEEGYDEDGEEVLDE